MAFLMSSRLLIRRLLESEKIFRSIVKTHSINSNISDIYLAEIKNMQIDPNVIAVSELLKFPRRTFYKIDKRSLEYIKHNSYNVIKEKGLATIPEVCKTILKSYLYDRIDFDVDSLLKDMSNNQIELDQDIYNYIVRYYCNNRNMKVVENLLNEMKFKGIELNDFVKMRIISSYIADKQPDKSEIFIQENQLEPNSFDVLYSYCYGYACNGDVDKLKEYLAEINEKQFCLTSFQGLLLYSRILSANVAKSSLDEIIDLTKYCFEEGTTALYKLMTRLISENNFEILLYLIKKLGSDIKNSTPFIIAFDNPRCPVEIFMEALEFLVNQDGICSKNINIFTNFTFDKAFEIAQKFRYVENWEIIHYSLFNKAISENSVPNIEKCLRFSYCYLEMSKVNLILQKVVIHSLLENGIVSNYEEILDIFTKQSKIFVPVILMEYLCTGEFDRYNKLRLKFNKPSLFRLPLEGSYVQALLMRNLANKDIKEWITEAGKCFPHTFINNILTRFVVYKVIYFSDKNSFDEIAEIVSYVKEWNLKFTSIQFDSLLKLAPFFTELIRSSVDVSENKYL